MRDERWRGARWISPGLRHWYRRVATRARWTRQDLAQLDAQIVAALEADNPQSVRHVFYLMTDPRLSAPVEKDHNGYRRVQRRILALRRSGAVPYRWVADATRTGFHVDTWAGAADFLEDVAALYRRDLWADVPTLVELWAESRSIASVLRADAHKRAISLYPTSGFTSVSLAYDAAVSARDAIRYGGKEGLHIVYVGDWDPAGLIIPETLLAELQGHLGEDRVTLDRVAITAEQIQQFDLPAKPRKATERRRPDVAETVEAEAMPAGILRRIVREAVEQFLPQGALEAARVAEEDERNAILSLAVGL